MMAGDFLTVEDVARTLGVSSRHARRLADSGAVVKVARGLIDRVSVESYLQSRRQGRTRAWAEHTAWGAVALLAGREPNWLGASQASRLRQTLREMSNLDDLLTRMRDRAEVRTFEAHRAALPRLRSLVESSSTRTLGVTDSTDGSIDGYLRAGELDDVVHSLALRADPRGTVTLRVTGFDFDHVRELVGTSTVASIDASTSTDPRLRGSGRRLLESILGDFR